MGLFGGTKVYVSSVASNMAGDLTDRINYLKTTISSSIVTGNSNDLAGVLQNSYMHGPGLRMRSFFEWAQHDLNYGEIGVPTMRIDGTYAIPDYTALKTAINPYAPDLIKIYKADMGPADYTWWADWWVWNNHGEDLGKAYTSEFNNSTGEITITYAGHWSGSFTPTDFDRNGTYLYCAFATEIGGDFGGTYPGIFIYKFGSGNADLDALAIEIVNTEGEFYPFIPLRLDNEFLSDTYYPLAYTQAKKGYKKAFGSSGTGFDKVIDKLDANPHLSDMDYAYCVFGTSLNTEDNTSKQYIYQFFHNLLMVNQLGDHTDYATYASQQATYQSQIASWEAWHTAQSNPSDPLYGTAMPAVSSAPTGKQTTITINADGPLPSNLNMQISWHYIHETFGAGLGKPGAKTGEVWFDTVGTDVWGNFLYGGTGRLATDDTKSDIIRLYWQIDSTSYKVLELGGFVHRNYIYAGKFVEISMRDALEDANESGFIVPLHKPTMRDLGLVAATQLATECCYVVINCYQVVHTSFLGGLLKLLTFVAIIAVVVITQGAAAPGLLGTAGSVGAALGATGLTATIIGAIINAIAAMIVLSIIQKVSVAVLGDKLGAIIGAVVGFVAVTLGSGLMNGQSLSAAWGNMMRVDSLLQLTNAVGSGISGYIQASVMDLQHQTQELEANYTKASKEISQLYAQNFGYGNGVIDPMSLTEAQLGNFVESASSFLARTLMTGSDIASLSMNMLTNFTSLTLDTNLSMDAGA